MFAVNNAAHSNYTISFLLVPVPPAFLLADNTVVILAVFYNYVSPQGQKFLFMGRLQPSVLNSRLR